MKRMSFKGKRGRFDMQSVRQFLVAILCVWLVPGAAAAWNTETLRDASTIEIRTQDSGAAPHWFKVWVVVLKGKVFVRLGSRAVGRLERNVTGQVVRVRTAAEGIERVKLVAVPELAERVASAMADKYWSDVLVRFASHPMTVRLDPAPEAAK